MLCEHLNEIEEVPYVKTIVSCKNQRALNMLEVPSANKNRSQRCSGSPYLRMTPSPVHMNNKSKFFKPAKQISEFDVLEDDDAPKVRVQSARARKSDESAFLFKNEE